MIQVCKDRSTEQLFRGKCVRPYEGFARQADKRQRLLDAADTLDALRRLPSNRLWYAKREVSAMTFPILIESCDGQFAASLLGMPNVRMVGPTRSQALEALQVDITQRIARGELLSLEIEAFGGSTLAGKYRTDPTLRTICAEAYRRRDAEGSR